MLSDVSERDMFNVGLSLGICVEAVRSHLVLCYRDKISRSVCWRRMRLTDSRCSGPAGGVDTLDEGSVKPRGATSDV